jgi:hypothetical protein
MIKESNNLACFVSKINFLAAVGNMHLKKGKTEDIFD